MVLNVFCESVNLNFRFVHLDARVEHRNSVDLAGARLFIEKGPLAHTDGYVHNVATNVVERATDVSSVLSDHLVEIEITDFARIFGSLHRLLLHFLCLLVLFTALVPLLLHLLDVVKDAVASLGRLISTRLHFEDFIINC